MEIVGINGTCQNECVADAFRKINYKLRKKRVSWPRTKAVVGIRVDVKTGYAVAFVTKEELEKQSS